MRTFRLAHRLTFVAALVVFLGMATEAEGQRRRVYTTLHTGYTKLMEDKAGGGSISFLGGGYLRLGHGISIGAEGGVYRLGIQRGVSGFAFNQRISKQSMMNLNGMVRVELGGRWWQPYLVGGAGVYRTKSDLELSALAGAGGTIPGSEEFFEREETSPGFSIGFGSERILVFRQSGLSVEARWQRVLDTTTAEDFPILFEDVVGIYLGVIF